MSYSDFAKWLAISGLNTMGETTPIIGPKNPSHKFPNDLWSRGQEPFIYFNIRSPSDPTLKPFGNISMYMPSTIKVNYGAGWTDFTQEAERLASVIGVDVNDITKSLSEGNMSGLYDSTIGAMKQNSEISNIAKYMVDNAAQKALGPSYAQKIRKGMNNNQDMVQNPFNSILYQGPVLRSFQLDFGLYARNAEESESIRKIIKAFKLAMHPNAEKGNMSTFFDYPYCFDIFLLTPDSHRMFNIRRAALTDMMVDYAGAGSPSFFNTTWAPVDIQMSLTFKEMELLTQNEIDQNY